MKKASKIIDIIFVIISILCLCEFIFIKGMFSWLISFCTIILFGAVQIIFSIINKSYYKAIITLLLVVSICSGYLALA